MDSVTELREWMKEYQLAGHGRGTVFALLLRWGTHPNVAADLLSDAIQEAFSRVLQVYGSRKTPFHDFTHFANTVTKTAVNWLHDRNRQVRGLTSVFDEELVAPVTDPRTPLVGAALGRLGTDDQLLITEGIINGLSLDELAERFLEADDRSANARRLCVRRRLREAINRLRAMYAEMDIE